MKDKLITMFIDLDNLDISNLPQLRREKQLGIEDVNNCFKLLEEMCLLNEGLSQKKVTFEEQAEEMKNKPGREKFGMKQGIRVERVVQEEVLSPSEKLRNLLWEEEEYSQKEQKDGRQEKEEEKREEPEELYDKVLVTSSSSYVEVQSEKKMVHGKIVGFHDPPIILDQSDSDESDDECYEEESSEDEALKRMPPKVTSF